MPGPGLQRRVYVNGGYKFTHNETGRYTIIRLTHIEPPVRSGEKRRRAVTLYVSCLDASFDLAKGRVRVWDFDAAVDGGAFSVEVEVMEINKSAARLRFFVPDYVRVERLGSKRPDLESDTCQQNLDD